MSTVGVAVNRAVKKRIDSALALLLAEVAGRPDAREIALSFVPENTAARALYLAAGFRETGEVEDGEIVMRRPLER